MNNNIGDFMNKYFGIFTLLAISFTASAIETQAPKIKCFAKQMTPGLYGESAVRFYTPVSTELKAVSLDSEEGIEVLSASAEIILNETSKCIGRIKVFKQSDELKIENLSVTMKTQNGSFTSNGIERANIKLDETEVSCSCNFVN